MPNPYKTAELRRKEEAERKRREAEEREKAEKATQETQDEPEAAGDSTYTPETENPVERKEEPVETDLLADLDVGKSYSKTFSFYLTIKNVQKLERIAKRKGVSSSKLLDHIISKL